MTSPIACTLPRLQLGDLINLIPYPARQACRKILQDHGDRLRASPGSSKNHQAWPGGYIDHLVDAMNLAVALYHCLERTGRPLPFTLGSVLLVLFLHDLEKPWKYVEPKKEFRTKVDRRTFRESMLTTYGINLSPEEMNALTYVEGEGDDYNGHGRVMNELAAFCHSCDSLSARLYHNYPLAQGDGWTGAKRSIQNGA